MSVVLLSNIIAAGRNLDTKTEAFDLGLHQPRPAMTTRRSGSMGSTDGVCDGDLFSSGSVQDREAPPG